MGISRYADYLTERLGVSGDVMAVASRLRDLLDSNPRQTEFEVQVRGAGGRMHAVKLVVDRSLDVAGTFTPSTLTIRVKDRDDSRTLLHEVKHMHLYLVNGRHNSETDIVAAFNHLAYSRLDTSILKDRDFLALYMVFYLTDRNEFEAYYHDHYLALIWEVRNHLESLGRRDVPTLREVTHVWGEMMKRADFPQYQFICSTAKPGTRLNFGSGVRVPAVQSPFKFEHWASERSIDALIYSWMKLPPTDPALEGAPGDRLGGLRSAMEGSRLGRRLMYMLGVDIPPSARKRVAHIKAWLEKSIEKRKGEYCRKFQRLPALVAETYPSLA